MRIDSPNKYEIIKQKKLKKFINYLQMVNQKRNFNKIIRDTSVDLFRENSSTTIIVTRPMIYARSQSLLKVKTEQSSEKTKCTDHQVVKVSKNQPINVLSPDLDNPLFKKRRSNAKL